MSNMDEITFLRGKVVELEQRRIQMGEAFARIVTTVSAQAEEESLWFKDPVLLRSSPAQNALRAMHTAVMNEAELFTSNVKLAPAAPPPPDQL